MQTTMMNITNFRRRQIAGSTTRRIVLSLTILFFFSFVLPTMQTAHAGAYVNSGHGDSSSGVNRTVMTGYATGNCAHCHEQHTSVGGGELAPVDGVPSPYALFTTSFDTTKLTNTYLAIDNFCFYCHDNTTTVQSPAFQNTDYSEVFGCGTAGTQSILANFNLASYHNLNDVLNFTDGENTAFPWFNSSTNPCDACHNPHIGRRNWNTPQDVAFSAISRPSDHFNLFTQSMDDTYTTNYEPPYCSNTTNREPAASADAVAGRANTLDYVAFCTDCHNTTNTIPSTSISGGARNLIQVDWTVTGDKHGVVNTDGTNNARKAPYSTAPPANTGVLSCLDCHEPHGSANITLLRRRVNGGDLAGPITTALPSPPGTGTDNSNKELGYLCVGCHQDDAATVNGPEPSWEDVHHNNTGRPYVQSGPCSTCHPGNGNPPPAIACDKCHFHGGDDSWLGSNAVGLGTF